MAVSVPLLRALPAFTIAITVLFVPVYAQINTACSPAAITSFASCLNFINNSTANGTTPSSACCNSLRSITSNGTSCFCLLVTGSVPFQIPINRTLAISLPRACNMPGVPLQCKASASPVPAPGPAALAPTPSTRASPALSPTASSVPEAESPAALTPESDATPALTPPSSTGSSGSPTGASGSPTGSPTGASGTPTTNSGSRPVLTPSAAKPAYSVSPSFLLAVLGVTFLKQYY